MLDHGTCKTAIAFNGSVNQAELVPVAFEQLPMPVRQPYKITVPPVIALERCRDIRVEGSERASKHACLFVIVDHYTRKESGREGERERGTREEGERGRRGCRERMESERMESEREGGEWRVCEK